MGRRSARYVASGRDWAGYGVRWVIGHRLVLITGLIAALPVLFSVGRALRADWTPVFDDAIMAVRSFDVFSRHAPLVGQYSDASLPGERPVFNLGPMVFWLLALPVRLPGDWALPVSVGIVNTASIVGVVALARRRGGRVFMFTTAVALAVMCRSLPSETFHGVVNNAVSLLPFTLLLFLAWSVACGEYRLLPVTVLVASFVAQAHFSVAPASLAVLVVALVCLFWVRTRHPRAARSGEHPRRWFVAALGVALVCWSAPMLDQLFHRPGNFVRIVQTATADQKKFETAWAWHADVRTIGVPPWWLRPPSETFIRRTEDLTSSPGAVAIASYVLLLGGLLFFVLVGRRRGRPDLVAVGTLALVINGAVVLLTASLPERLFFSVDKGLIWASPVGMFTWLAAGWSLAVVVGPERLRAVIGQGASARLRPAVASVAGLIVTAIVSVLVATAQEPDANRWAFHPVRSITSGLDARLPRDRAVLVGSFPVAPPARAVATSLTGFGFQTAIVYQLRRSGIRVFAPPNLDLAEKLGAQYRARGYDDLLELNHDRGRGGKLAIVRVPANFPAGVTGDTLSVSVAPAPPPPAAAMKLACPNAKPASRSKSAAEKFRVVPGQVSGSVDHSQIVGGDTYFCGWAAGAKNRKPADRIVVLSEGRFVGAVKPTTSRPDVVKAGRALDDVSGYSIRLPLSLIETGGQKLKIELFGVEHGEASHLPFSCAAEPHDFGC